MVDAVCCITTCSAQLGLDALLCSALLLVGLYLSSRDDDSAISHKLSFLIEVLRLHLSKPYVVNFIHITRGCHISCFAFSFVYGCFWKIREEWSLWVDVIFLGVGLGFCSWYVGSGFWGLWGDGGR